MPVFYNYSNAILGTQSTVGGATASYDFAPPYGSSWSWSGTQTNFTVRENDGATNYNGDPFNEFISPQEQIGGTWEQVVLINGTAYQTIWDYTFEIQAADGSILRVAVIDVDLNNDNDLNDPGEDGYFLVFPDGVPAPNTTYTVRNIVANGSAVPHASLGATIVCFTQGTMIATAKGMRPIEMLEPGDMVKTRDNGMQPLRWIGSKRVRARGDLAPIHIQPGGLNNKRSLRVSPQHRMLVRDWRVALVAGEEEALVAAKDLVNGRDILREEGGWVTYVHILFDEHQIVFAEGCPSESLHPGHCALDALAEESREEVLRLFPELRDNLEGYGPTAAQVLRGYQAACLAGYAP